MDSIEHRPFNTSLPNLSKEPRIVFARSGNGVDLKRSRNDDGFKYEDICFQALAASFPSHFLIGPHLIDHAFTKEKSLITFKRPDIVFFRSINGEQCVSGLSEIKLHPFTDFRDKLKGFEKLLDFLRENPGMISDMFNPYLREDQKLGDITVPPNGPVKRVHITLVTPPHKDATRVFKRQGMHINRLPVFPAGLRKAA